MRVLAALLLISVIAVSAVSAEQLMTSLPLGQGKIGVLGGYVQDSTWGLANSGWTLNTIGAAVGYGLTDKLDLIGQYGSSNVTGQAAGWTTTANGYVLMLKYALMAEGKDSPVSVSVCGSYKNAVITSNATGITPTTHAALTVGCSKVMAPFVPYGDLTYRKLTSAAADAGSALDITVGTAIAWSTKGAVFVEYTNQAITPTGGAANYTSGQIAAGVGYTI